MLPTTPYTPLPLDGSLDIFQAFEFQSSKNPDHALFRYDSESASEGYEEISWSRAVKMFDTTAQILRHRLTETDYTRPPVVGILAATSSIPYAALVFGALRAGYTVFPLSTRNSDVATAHLIAESGIRYLLVSSDGHMQEIARKATALLKARSLHVDITPIPTYEEIFTTQGADLDALPPAPPIDDERIILIAHSSGSTSFPKVIPLTQRYLQSMVQAVGGSDLSSEVRSAQASAMFHAAGFVAIARAAYTGMTLAFFPPTTNAEIPTPERVLGSALATKCTTLGCSPVFLEHWVKSPADVNKLRTFSCVLFGGGPLAQVVGDTLEADRVNLLAVYGSTETGGISAVKKHGGGWQYFEFLPTTLPVLVPVDGEPSESLFQLIIKDCTTNRLAVSNVEIDGVPAFDTKDIVQQHPTNPKLYRVYARVDDQIMHSNGEKTNPGPLEEILVQNSLIKAAIFFGRLKPHAGVLVTPSENAVNLELFRDAIWPTVEQANKFAPAHSRLFKNMIIVSDPSKPFQVTAKGTLRRNAILEDYAQEIEDAYADFDSTPSSFSTVGFISKISMKATLEIVRTHVHGNIHPNILDNENIFEAGGDSLLAARIRRGIMESLLVRLRVPNAVVQSLPQDFVFALPTITSLSAFIYGLIIGVPDNTPSTAAIVAQKEPNIVRLREPSSKDPPLILVHDGSGDLYALSYMQTHFKTGLWGIQVTDETPRASFIAQTEFYYKKIKESQPRGPYRIGGYSAGVTMACRITRLLEENGDQVVQLVLIDNSPFMLLFPHPDFDQSANFNDTYTLDAYHERSVRSLCKAALTWQPAWWHRFSVLAWERWNGRVQDEDMSAPVVKAYQNLVDGSARDFTFLLSLAAGDRKGYPEVTAALVEWMKDIRAPVTLYKASDGVTIPPGLQEKWWAFGMDWSCKNIRVVEVAGDHCSIVHSDYLVDDLQKFPGVGSREVEA
ncbi:hypothetical protein C8F04DRAFT_280833 [Mycena alexandri]|uniref:Carrier domain-containing protein n=1 Tax=Mycena alexandri TaxID=1745969 RepID=A0AAD6T8P8_9AGAR|nr:hypothetical protein C8F04DRAFT_280833 [Mycena alexandri]